MAASRQVKMLVKKHGEEKAIKIIKDDHKRFPNKQNYPNGVRVYLFREPQESILVGSTN